MNRRVIVRVLAATVIGFACLSVVVRVTFGPALGLLVGIPSDHGMALSAAACVALLAVAVFLVAEKDHS